MTSLAERRWPVRISTVRLGPDRYRVLRAVERFGRAHLYEDWTGASLELDHGTARQLALAWALAARSPRSLVYLPLRAAAPAGAEPRALDLLLLHHSLGFPPSRWKRVRQRLGAGLPHSVTLPPTAWPEFPVEEHRRVHHHDFRDHVRCAVAADTVVLTGSRHAFDLRSAELRAFAAVGPVPGTHICAEVYLGSRRAPNSLLFHPYYAG